jgi:hypothetical protein
MDDTSIPVLIDDNEEANEEDLRIVTTVHSCILGENPDAGGAGEQGRGRRGTGEE